MTTMLSAITEATGMKPGDDVIAMGAAAAGKMKAIMYCQAVTEAVTPELRLLFSTHLQNVLAEHQRCTDLMVKRGWYQTGSNPQAALSDALEKARPVLQ